MIQLVRNDSTLGGINKNDYFPNIDKQLAAFNRSINGVNPAEEIENIANQNALEERNRFEAENRRQSEANQAEYENIKRMMQNGELVHRSVVQNVQSPNLQSYNQQPIQTQQVQSQAVNQQQQFTPTGNSASDLLAELNIIESASNHNASPVQNNANVQTGNTMSEEQMQLNNLIGEASRNGVNPDEIINFVRNLSNSDIVSLYKSRNNANVNMSQGNQFNNQQYVNQQYGYNNQYGSNKQSFNPISSIQAEPHGYVQKEVNGFGLSKDLLNLF